MDEIISEIEKFFPDCAWSISKITNEYHAINLLGVGYGVTIFYKSRVIFGKGKTIREAVDIAIHRMENNL